MENQQKKELAPMYISFKQKKKKIQKHRELLEAMELQIFLLMKIMLTIALLGLISILFRVADTVILNPMRLRTKLRRQGIGGPPPSFLLGNILDLKKAKSKVPNPAQGEEGIVHNSSFLLFPSFEQWRKQYGILLL